MARLEIQNILGKGFIYAINKVYVMNDKMPMCFKHDAVILAYRLLA